MPKNNNHVSKDGAPLLQNLAYIQDMLGELRKVADTEGADMLCYLIEMAYIETGDIISASRSVSSGLENEGNKSSGVSL